MAPWIRRGQTLLPAPLAPRHGALSASTALGGLLPKKAPARLAVDDASGDHVTHPVSPARLITRVRPDCRRRVGHYRHSPRGCAPRLIPAAYCANSTRPSLSPLRSPQNGVAASRHTNA